LPCSQGAHGFNCCPRGEPFPRFFTHPPPAPRHPPRTENTGSAINNRLPLLPFPTPLSSDSSSGQPLCAFHLSTVRLMLLHHSLSPPPQHLHVCNCIRLVTAVQLYGPAPAGVGPEGFFPPFSPGTEADVLSFYSKSNLTRSVVKDEWK